MAFADLKKKTGNGLEKLQSKLNEKVTYGNANEWKFEVDASGNGSAVVRFLPAPEGEELPFVKLYGHSFKENGQWYIENSRTTLEGEQDPVGISNSELWQTGSEENKKIASSRRRQTKYILNILVIKDPKNPSNEGQVKLWKIGKTLFDKIEQAIRPEFDDEEPIDPFDFWEGANFKLKAFNGTNGQRTYEKSAFDKPSALFDGDDKKLEELYAKLHSLQAEIAPSKFKSFEELQKRFDKVTGNVSVKAEEQSTTYTSSAKQTSVVAKEVEVSDASDDLDEYRNLLDD